VPKPGPSAASRAPSSSSGKNGAASGARLWERKPSRGGFKSGSSFGSHSSGDKFKDSKKYVPLPLLCESATTYRFRASVRLELASQVSLPSQTSSSDVPLALSRPYQSNFKKRKAEGDAEFTPGAFNHHALS